MTMNRLGNICTSLRVKTPKGTGELLLKQLLNPPSRVCYGLTIPNICNTELCHSHLPRMTL